MWFEKVQKLEKKEKIYIYFISVCLLKPYMKFVENQDSKFSTKIFALI